MNTIAATEAKNNFGNLLTEVQAGPVEIAKQGRGVAVLLSMKDYEKIQESLKKTTHTSFEWLQSWRKSVASQSSQSPLDESDYLQHLDQKYGE